MNDVSRRGFIGSAVSAGVLLHPGFTWAQASASSEEAKAASGFTRHVVSEIGKLTTASLSPSALEWTRHIVLDYTAVTISGSKTPDAKITLSVAREQGGPGMAQVMGTPYRLPAMQAALVEGVASHSEGFDDMGPGSHPSTCALPAILAVGQEVNASGAKVIEAIAQSFEALKIIGSAIGFSGQARGVDMIGVQGVMGATLGAAVLLDLDATQKRNAIGIAAMQASGLVGGLGDMTASLTTGHAAMAGVLSAQLAKKGFTGPADILESRDGYANVIIGNRTGFNPTAPGTSIGERLGVQGLIFRRHATCGGALATIDSIQAIRKKRPFTLDEVAEVEMIVPKYVPCAIYDVPKTGSEGGLSLRYAASLALTGSSTGPESFTDARVLDPTLVRAGKLVRISPTLPDMSHPHTAVIKFKNGETVRESAFSVGVATDEQLPRQRQELELKFSVNAGPVIGESATKSLLALARRFETLPSVREYCDLTRTKA